MTLCKPLAAWCRLLLAMAALAGGGAADAHDTWFAAQPGRVAGAWAFALGTGERFPQQAFTVPAGQLQQQGCRHGAAAPVALKPVKATPVALRMSTRAAPQGAARGQHGAITCWAVLQPQDIRIEPVTVKVYLDEIKAPTAVRQAWQDLQRRGLPWVERYRKHARIELLDRRLGGGDAPPAQALPMGMDIVLDSGLERLHAGDEIRLQVLREGRPLADQAIEARSQHSAFGLWLRTDAQGRAALRLPLAGQWLLRGTHLRLSAAQPDTWESDFVTLVLDVAPRPR